MADEGKITLFGSKFSVFSQRVQIALTEKKIPFELILVDIKNKPQKLLEANPIHKKIPTIIHRGRPLAESLVILEYLEDAFLKQVPLMPEDAYERSKIRFWIDYIIKSFSKISAGLRAPPGSPEKQASYDFTATFFRTLDETMTSFSADGPFFTGDKFGLVDVALAPLYSNMGLVKAIGGPLLPGPNELPQLYRWVKAVEAHPSVSSTLAAKEATTEYAKTRLQGLVVRASATNDFQSGRADELGPGRVVESNVVNIDKVGRVRDAS